MSETKAENRRKTYLDVLRIIACFFVIVNHTDNNVLLSLNCPSTSWFMSAALLYICKIAVPVFIMISGAVLVDKEESYKTIYKKRVLRTALVIVIFSLIYYIDYLVQNHEAFSLITFWQIIIHVPITNAYWYLYMYLGLMVMLPIIRKLVKNMEQKDFIYCLIIWLIFNGLFPIINNYFKYIHITYCFNIPIIAMSIIYFMMGYFIENKLDKKYFNKTILIICIILSIICICISIGLTYYDFMRNAENKVFMDNTEYITVIVPSVSVFYVAKYIDFKRKNGKECKIITHIATHTFGIYLLSDFFITKFEFISNYLSTYIHKIPAMFVLELIVFIVGYAITWVLKKIPLVKKLI